MDDSGSISSDDDLFLCLERHDGSEPNHPVQKPTSCLYDDDPPPWLLFDFPVKGKEEPVEVIDLQYDENHDNAYYRCLYENLKRHEHYDIEAVAKSLLVMDLSEMNLHNENQMPPRQSSECGAISQIILYTICVIHPPTFLGLYTYKSDQNKCIWEPIALLCDRLYCLDLQSCFTENYTICKLYIYIKFSKAILEGLFAAAYRTNEPTTYIIKRLSRMFCLFYTGKSIEDMIIAMLTPQNKQNADTGLDILCNKDRREINLLLFQDLEAPLKILSDNCYLNYVQNDTEKKVFTKILIDATLTEVTYQKYSIEYLEKAIKFNETPCVALRPVTKLDDQTYDHRSKSPLDNSFVQLIRSSGAWVALRSFCITELRINKLWLHVYFDQPTLRVQLLLYVLALVDFDWFEDHFGKRGADVLLWYVAEAKRTLHHRQGCNKHNLNWSESEIACFEEVINMIEDIKEICFYYVLNDGDFCDNEFYHFLREYLDRIHDPDCAYFVYLHDDLMKKTLSNICQSDIKKMLELDLVACVASPQMWYGAIVKAQLDNASVEKLSEAYRAAMQDGSYRDERWLKFVELQRTHKLSSIIALMRITSGSDNTISSVETFLEAKTLRSSNQYRQTLNSWYMRLKELVSKERADRQSVIYPSRHTPSLKNANDFDQTTEAAKMVSQIFRTDFSPDNKVSVRDVLHDMKMQIRNNQMMYRPFGYLQCYDTASQISLNCDLSKKKNINMLRAELYRIVISREYKTIFEIVSHWDDGYLLETSGLSTKASNFDVCCFLVQSVLIHTTANISNHSTVNWFLWNSWKHSETFDVYTGSKSMFLLFKYIRTLIGLLQEDMRKPRKGFKLVAGKANSRLPVLSTNIIYGFKKGTFDSCHRLDKAQLVDTTKLESNIRRMVAKYLERREAYRKQSIKQDSRDTRERLAKKHPTMVNLLLAKKNQKTTRQIQRINPVGLEVSVSASHQAQRSSSSGVSASHQAQRSSPSGVSASHQAQRSSSSSVSARHQAQRSSSSSVSATPPPDNLDNDSASNEQTAVTVRAFEKNQVEYGDWQVGKWRSVRLCLVSTGAFLSVKDINLLEAIKNQEKQKNGRFNFVASKQFWSKKLSDLFLLARTMCESYLNQNSEHDDAKRFNTKLYDAISKCRVAPGNNDAIWVLVVCVFLSFKKVYGFSSTPSKASERWKDIYTMLVEPHRSQTDIARSCIYRTLILAHFASRICATKGFAIQWESNHGWTVLQDTKISDMNLVFGSRAFITGWTKVFVDANSIQKSENIDLLFDNIKVDVFRQLVSGNPILESTFRLIVLEDGRVLETSSDCYEEMALQSNPPKRKRVRVKQSTNSHTGLLKKTTRRNSTRQSKSNSISSDDDDCFEDHFKT